MRERFRVLIGTVCVVMCAVTLWHFLRPMGVFDATYKGRSLMSWSTASLADGSRASEETSTAFRFLCSSNLPAMTEALNHDPDARRSSIETKISWLPFPLREWLFRGPLADRAEDRANAAEEAIKVLGVEAAPAIPDVERLLISTNSHVAMRAFRLLPHLGSNSAPWLLSMITEERQPQHVNSLLIFYELTSHLGTNTTSAAIPVLIHCLQSSYPGDVRLAAACLGNIKVEPTKSVPALTRLLSNTIPETRSQAMASLGEFRADARDAIPDLVQALQDPDTRLAAANALVKIAPEVYTNADSLLPAGWAREVQSKFRKRYGMPPH